jgi:PKHD-type hydroxylase
MAADIKVQEGSIKDGNIENRKSKIKWINSNSIVKEIGKIVQLHNKKCNWNFDLKTFEPLQYTIYEIGNHYDWHIDSHIKPYKDNTIRKISFTICLNEDYEGGEFELSWPNPKPEKHLYYKFNEQFSMGTIVSFPSFIWHRVKPVTKGIRKVLVGWAIGAPFK